MTILGEKKNLSYLLTINKTQLVVILSYISQKQLCYTDVFARIYGA